MTRTKNTQLRQIKEKYFKKYCNIIFDLIKVNKKSHYQKCFEENKTNSKAIQQGIHDIIYFKKSNRANTSYSLLIEENIVTDSQDISEDFNNFLMSIDKDLQKSISSTKKHFSDYLKTPNIDDFIFQP